MPLLPEIKHFFLAETEIEVAGQPSSVDMSSVAGTLGLRIHFDQPRGSRGTGATSSRAADNDDFRFYLLLRAGVAIFPYSDEVSSARMDTPVGFGGAAVGFNFDRHWGVEFVGEGLPGRLEASLLETTLSTPEEGEVVEYSVWTSILQVWLRYPMLNDKLVPYLIAGGGLGFTEFNDRKQPAGDGGVTGGFETSVVGAAGIGVEYFVANNIAVGFEAKYVFLFDSEIMVNNQPAELQVDPVFLTLGLRAYF